MTTYYKILGQNGESIHGGDLQWSIPTQIESNGAWIPGVWHKVSGNIIVCENGLHLVDEAHIPQWLKAGCRIFEAEYAGEIDDSEIDVDGKIAVSEARLTREVPLPKWWADAMTFIHTIPDTPFFKPDGNPDPAWKLFTAPSLAAARGAARDAARDAARGAAWDAARGAAWDAARDAARGAAWDAARGAAWDAARGAAWDAARGAAWDAARGAARGAARVAARDAAWDAAWDAKLHCLVNFICSDLPIDPVHKAHAAARWDVWRKGYCLLCDVNCVLYVYAAE